MENPVNIISPSTEAEVRKIVMENFLVGIGCLLLVVMLGFTMYLFFGVMCWIHKDNSSPPVKTVSPSTEMELRRILVENFLFGMVCLCLGLILCFFVDMYLGEDLMLLAVILTVFIWMGAGYNGVLANFMGDGNGERVCRWCTNRLVVKFLMLYYCTRSRTKRVVQAIEKQLQLAMDKELV